ncbi:hypothetical protein AgCh_016702 [Apium graveolens]
MMELVELDVLRNALEVLIDAVDSIKLMDLTRSFFNDDNVSSNVFITSQEAIKDLICLNWIECSVTSFKTVNYDLINLQNASTFGLKLFSMKKKRTKMIKSKEGIQLVCSLASCDQCSVAKGIINIANCAAADYRSSSSLLVNYLHLEWEVLNEVPLLVKKLTCNVVESLRVSSIIKLRPECLCQVLNGGGSLGLTINQTQALPITCNVKTQDLSSCKADGLNRTPARNPDSTKDAPPVLKACAKPSKTAQMDNEGLQSKKE